MLFFFSSIDTVTSTDFDLHPKFSSGFIDGNADVRVDMESFQDNDTLSRDLSAYTLLFMLPLLTCCVRRIRNDYAKENYEEVLKKNSLKI